MPPPNNIDKYVGDEKKDEFDNAEKNEEKE